MLHLCHQSAILRSIERRTFVAPVCIMCLLDFWHRAPLFQLWGAGEPLQRLHQEVISRLSFSWSFFFRITSTLIFLFPSHTLASRRLLPPTNRQADAFLCMYFFGCPLIIMCFEALASAQSSCNTLPLKSHIHTIGSRRKFWDNLPHQSGRVACNGTS